MDNKHNQMKLIYNMYIHQDKQLNLSNFTFSIQSIENENENTVRTLNIV